MRCGLRSDGKTCKPATHKETCNWNVLLLWHSCSYSIEVVVGVGTSLSRLKHTPD